MRRQVVQLLLVVMFSGMGMGMGAVAKPFQHLDFSLHKLGDQEWQPTLLIVGGIQGDEPGGFNAASLLVTDYQVEYGNVWVVPNLNFKSIIRRSRGIHGDMNRKFLQLDSADPDYAAVQKIKSMILDPRVSMILNLHDGSGFYHPEYHDALRNPERWGQSIIIDQASLQGSGIDVSLEQVAAQLSGRVNQRLNNPRHKFHVKNTYTNAGNPEMEKTLTYFAARHLKPAFGVEASKSFLTHERAYYHLQVIEAAMEHLGIRYQRRLELNKPYLKERIDNNVQLSFFENKIFLDMQDARKNIRYVPLKKNSPLYVNSNNPLVAIIRDRGHYQVRYGNRHVSRLSPEYFDYDNSIDGIDILVDGRQRFVPFGRHFRVAEYFRVNKLDNYRVNVIGYYGEAGRDEAGELIRYGDISQQFSIDKDAKRFRVEVYTGNRYCGMVIADFRDKQLVSEDMQTGLRVKHSDSNI
ncbi:MAG: M99 family carboxypeptidase catalytic domain-containing protein [Gammaproteobacteria bacterium]